MTRTSFQIEALRREKVKRGEFMGLTLHIFETMKMRGEKVMLLIAAVILFVATTIGLGILSANLYLKLDLARWEADSRARNLKEIREGLRIALAEVFARGVDEARGFRATVNCSTKDAAIDEILVGRLVDVEPRLICLDWHGDTLNGIVVHGGNDEFLWRDPPSLKVSELHLVVGLIFRELGLPWREDKKQVKK
jgi:hypothetical protein